MSIHGFEEFDTGIRQRNADQGPQQSRNVNRLWTPEADGLVRTLSAAEAAEQTDGTLSAIYMRRNKLGMPDARMR
jgi:hypothetical protein